MRVLVAGRNAEVLATTASAFAGDLQISTAATKAESLHLLERTEFDLIIACETLGDGLGLEVLSHVAVNTPNTLRIFAARPSTLDLLEGELGLFGLFRTLPYPIDFRKLWAALRLARGGAVEPQVLTAPTAPAPRQQPRGTASARAPSRAVTLASSGAAPSTARSPASSSPPARIPETEAFRRALAKRNAAKLEANSPLNSIHVANIIGQPQHAGSGGKRRREPAVPNESLSQLARLTTTHRSNYALRGVVPRRKRVAWVVGSGVFAAGTAAVLTFFMLHTNSKVGHSALPPIASIDRPIPHNVFPWQDATQPTRPTTFVGHESGTPAAADLEAQAEATSENFEVEPGHPGPPQPNPPLAPADPPAIDSPVASPEAQAEMNMNE